MTQIRGAVLNLSLVVVVAIKTILRRLKIAKQHVWVSFIKKASKHLKDSGGLDSGNRADIINEAVNVSVCSLPREQGNCLAYIERWGFDTASKRCVQFIYGGCGGNGNNFETKAACEQRCLG